MEIKELEEKVIKILEGIDWEESQSDEAWWANSVGASFGCKKLNEIRAAFKEYSESEGRKVAG